MLWKSFSLIKVWPRRESWFIKSVDIMENCHCHQGGEGETRGILRTKWSRRWDLHFSWLQLAEKPQPHSLANASEERHFSSYQFISTISRLFYCPHALWQLTTNLDQNFDFMTVDEGGQCGLGGNGWSILICWLANGPSLSSIQPGIPGISQLLKGTQLAVGLRAIRLIVNQAPYLDRCWFCQNNCPRGNWVVYISEVGQTLFHPLPLPPFWPLFCLNLPDKLLAKI